MPLDMGQSSELPLGIPDIELSETEESLWKKLPYRERQAHSTLPPMLPAASVMETPQNVPGTILQLHNLIEHLHAVRSNFKEQNTICDDDTICSFHLLTMTLKWARTVLLEKYKYPSHTRPYPER